MQDLKSLIRTIPDYPKKGIMFRDVTTLMGNAQGFKATIEQMAAPYANASIEAVAGIEARGFILGGAIADRLGCGFVPLRKKGKLPWKTIGQEYTLEYGVDIIEMHEDAIRPGERILIVVLAAVGASLLLVVALGTWRGPGPRAGRRGHPPLRAATATPRRAAGRPRWERPNLAAVSGASLPPESIARAWRPSWRRPAVRREPRSCR